METQIGALILATDISRQNEYLSLFRSHLDRGDLHLDDGRHRHLVLQVKSRLKRFSFQGKSWEGWVEQKRHIVAAYFLRVGCKEREAPQLAHSLPEGRDFGTFHIRGFRGRVKKGTQSTVAAYSDEFSHEGGQGVDGFSGVVDTFIQSLCLLGTAEGSSGSAS